MIDCDPQCNLSQLVMQNIFDTHDLDFDDYYAGNLREYRTTSSKIKRIGRAVANIPPAPNNLIEVFRPIVEDLAIPTPQPNFYRVTPNMQLYLLAGMEPILILPIS